MGCYIEQLGSKFVIKKENFTDALKALKSVFVKENMTCHDSFGDHFMWVYTDDVLQSSTLEEALEEIRYKSEYDKEGNIIDIEFTGEKLGDDDIFFDSLAPYVESGSFITFEDEDHCIWMWKFNDKKMEEIYYL